MSDFNCERCVHPSDLKFSFEGSKTADVMIVFGNPVETDSGVDVCYETEKHFILDMFFLAGFPSDKIYLTTLVKCVSDNPGQRIVNCIELLRMQFKTVRPKTVVCFGSTVAKTLVGADFELEKPVQKGTARFVCFENPSNICKTEKSKLDFLTSLSKLIHIK